MQKSQDINTICRSVAKIYGVTLLIFDEGGNLIEQCSPNPESAVFLLTFSNLKERIFDLCAQMRRPRIISSEFGQL